MLGMLIGIVVGFFVLGPIGSLFGLLIGGFIYLKKPARPLGPRQLGSGRPSGHSPRCGCKACYRADGLL